jgi:hypothetical protein
MDWGVACVRTGVSIYLQTAVVLSMDCRCHTFHSLYQNTENRSVSVLPESAFKTATGIIVIAIIIDLRHYYNCRSNAFRIYTHSFLMESGTHYLKILFRVRPSVLSNHPISAENCIKFFIYPVDWITNESWVRFPTKLRDFYSLMSPRVDLGLTHSSIEWLPGLLSRA